MLRSCWPSFSSPFCWGQSKEKATTNEKQQGGFRIVNEDSYYSAIDPGTQKEARKWWAKQEMKHCFDCVEQKSASFCVRSAFAVLYTKRKLKKRNAIRSQKAQDPPLPPTPSSSVSLRAILHLIYFIFFEFFLRCLQWLIHVIISPFVDCWPVFFFFLAFESFNPPNVYDVVLFLSLSSCTSKSLTSVSSASLRSGCSSFTFLYKPMWCTLVVLGFSFIFANIQLAEQKCLFRTTSAIVAAFVSSPHTQQPAPRPKEFEKKKTLCVLWISDVFVCKFNRL